MCRLWQGWRCRGGWSSLAQTFPWKAADGPCTSCPLKSGQQTSSEGLCTVQLLQTNTECTLILIQGRDVFSVHRLRPFICSVFLSGHFVWALKKLVSGSWGGFFFLFVSFWPNILCQEEVCLHIAKLCIWFCEVGHLADLQKPSSNSGQCGASVGSEGTVEGPTVGGTCLLSDDGHSAGPHKYLGYWGAYVLHEGGQGARDTFLKHSLCCCCCCRIFFN